MRSVRQKRSARQWRRAPLMASLHGFPSEPPLMASPQCSPQCLLSQKAGRLQTLQHLTEVPMSTQAPSCGHTEEHFGEQNGRCGTWALLWVSAKPLLRLGVEPRSLRPQRRALTAARAQCLGLCSPRLSQGSHGCPQASHSVPGQGQGEGLWGQPGGSSESPPHPPAGTGTRGAHGAVLSITQNPKREPG